MVHIPVLQKEVLQYLDPKPNENFIDCTIGEGGHAAAILEMIAPRGKILGIDYQLRLKPRERLILAEGNFADLKSIVEKYKFRPVSGILFDLGFSSWHLEESGRGFSFQRREPLDMRYDINSQLTAEKIVNFWSKFEIEKILSEYGEEKFAGQIAERIVEERKIRPIKNTPQLTEIVRRSVGGRGKINPATRTFQALRIAVNDELGNLARVLPQAIEVLGLGGRLVVISFHSLEDRIVKNFFKNPSFLLLTKRPITPDFGEIKSNPRARSAKLRVVEKI